MGRGKSGTQLEGMKQSWKEARKVGDRLEEARWANAIGNHLKEGGSYVEALRWLRMDYDISRSAQGSAEARSSFMVTLHSMGEVHLRLQQYEEAQKYMDMHYESATESSDEVQLERASKQLGRLYLELFSKDDNSAYPKAKKYLEEAMERALALRGSQTHSGSFVDEVVDAYTNLGLLMEDRDDTDKALTYFLQALHICKEEEMGDTAPLTRVHHNLGRIYMKHRDWEPAFFHTRKDISICGRIEHMEGKAKGYINLGEIHRMRLEFDEALNCLKSAKSVAHRLEDEDDLKQLIDNNLEAVEDFKKMSVEFADKLQQHRQLRRKVEAAKDPSPGRSLLKQEFRALRALLELASAFEAWDQHLLLSKRLKQVCAKLHDLEKHGDAMGTVAESYENLRHFRKAYKWYNRCLEVCRRLRHIEGQAVSLVNCGNALDKCGDWDGAMQSYKQAVDLLKSREDEGKNLRLQIQALENIHSLYLLRLERFDEARELEIEIQRLKSLETCLLHRDSEECPETDCEEDAALHSEGSDPTAKAGQQCQTVPTMQYAPMARKGRVKTRTQRLRDFSSDEDVEAGDFDHGRCMATQDTGGEATGGAASQSCMLKPSSGTGGSVVNTTQRRSENRQRATVIVSDSESDSHEEDFTSKLLLKRRTPEKDELLCEVQANLRRRRIRKTAGRVEHDTGMIEAHGCDEQGVHKERGAHQDVKLLEPLVPPPAACRGEDMASPECGALTHDSNKQATRATEVAGDTAMMAHPSPVVPIPEAPEAHQRTLLTSPMKNGQEDRGEPPESQLPHFVGRPSKESAILPVHINGEVINVVVRREEDGPGMTTVGWLKQEIIRLSTCDSISGKKPIVRRLLCNGVTLKPVQSIEDVVLILKPGNKIEAHTDGWTHMALSDRYVAQCLALSCNVNAAVHNRLSRSEICEDEIRLSGCSLDDASACPLLAALDTHSPVSALDMSHNKLGNETMHGIQKLISTKSCGDLGLTLDVHHNHLGAGCLSQLCHCPITLSRLEVLNLSGNRLTDAVGRHLALLLEGCTALASLELNACGLTTRTIQKITSSLRPGCPLSKLSIGENNPIAGFAMADLLQKLATLESFAALDMRKVELDDVGVKGIISLLNCSKSTSTLVLRGTDIQNDGSMLISSFLERNPCKLLNLDLSSCGFHGVSVTTLCKQIMNIQGLSSLDLSDNRLSLVAAEAIAVGLERAGCRLKQLKLGRCRIGMQGVLRIIQALTANRTLLELDLAGNHVGAKLTTSLSSAQIDVLPADRRAGLLPPASVPQTSLAARQCDLGFPYEVGKITAGATSSSTDEQAVEQVPESCLEQAPDARDIADSEGEDKPEPRTPLFSSHSRKKFIQALRQHKSRQLVVRHHSLCSAIQEAEVLQALDLSDNGFSREQIGDLYDAWASSSSRRLPLNLASESGSVKFSTQGRSCCGW